jgi:hypothetical protein
LRLRGRMAGSRSGGVLVVVYVVGDEIVAE